MSRIIFVGLHNKPHMAPLDSGTKTGKLVDRIIAELSKETEIVKSNIFDVDNFPAEGIQFALVGEWYWTQLPDEDDIIILLGQATHLAYKNHCIRKDSKVIYVAHPASKRSHVDMDKYVVDVSKKIKSLPKLKEKS